MAVSNQKDDDILNNAAFMIRRRNTHTGASTNSKYFDLNKKLNMNLIQIEIWNLKLKHDSETWNWNLKLKWKLKMETWYWNLKLDMYDIYDYIPLLVTFGYFSSCGPQDQKYTFGGGICRIYSNLYEYYQPYQ